MLHLLADHKTHCMMPSSYFRHYSVINLVIFVPVLIVQTFC